MKYANAKTSRDALWPETDYSIVPLPDSEYGSLDTERIAQVRDLLLDFANEPGPAYLVVDFSQVQFFGASFVGVLVCAWDQLRRQNRRLALCGLTPYCARLIRVLHLDMLFPIFLGPPPTRKTNGALVDDTEREMARAGIHIRKRDVAWDPTMICLEYMGDDGSPIRAIIVPRGE